LRSSPAKCLTLPRRAPPQVCRTRSPIGIAIWRRAA
jgi:hypothetical protein